MIRLLENTAKSWLRREGFPVPNGVTVRTGEEAAAAALQMPGAAAVVKALLPFGRRGKAGAVRIAATPGEARLAATDLLGKRILGEIVEELYVEERIAIRQELYLAFILTGEKPQVLISSKGGVDVEILLKEHQRDLVKEEIDPMRGLQPWQAVALWSRAGVSGVVLRDLGRLTADLFALFQRSDALLLELNPIAIDEQSKLMVVGAMAGIDPNGIARHTEWAGLARHQAAAIVNERERKVGQANETLPGGECRYVELDGNIGLLVGGGGAGLYLHDMVIAAGGRPANHCVTPPTGGDTRKLHAVISAIIDNPRTKGLLVGFNFAQMARADLRVKTLIQVLKEKNIDTEKFPIVIRLFGAGEDVARQAASALPGIHYLQRGSSLEDAVSKIVDLCKGIGAGVAT